MIMKAMALSKGQRGRTRSKLGETQKATMQTL